jgi:AcrR family transcriptional regulator
VGNRESISKPAAGAGRRYAGKTREDRLADRRERLLEAGLEIFGTEGYFKASVEGLCSVAGVANRSFYEHFASKEDLLLTVYDDLLVKVGKEVSVALADAPESVEGGARAGLQAFVDAVLVDDRVARIVITGLIGVSERCERRRREALRFFAALIEEKSTRFAEARSLERRNRKVLRMALVGATIEALIEWREDPRQPVGEVVEEIVHLFVAGAEYDGP